MQDKKKLIHTLEDAAKEHIAEKARRDKEVEVLRNTRSLSSEDMKTVSIHLKEKALRHDAPTNAKQLHRCIEIIFGVSVPWTNTAEDSNAPFEWIHDVYFGKAPFSFAIGARLSGKTFGAYKLHYLLNTFKPGFSSRHAAANREQAAVAANYLKGAAQDPTLSSVFDRGKVGNSEVRWRNSSHWKIVTGSTAGVCLNGWTSVVTDRGNLTIQEIVNKKLPVRVRSYNFDRKCWEWKRVVGYFDHGPETNYVRIITTHKTERQLPSMTANHEVYLEDGQKIQAGNVRPGDRVAVWGYEFTHDQEQVILGGLLGDSTIGKEGRYSFAHGMNQKYYLMWKSEVFRYMDVDINEEVGGFGTSCVKARVQADLTFKVLRDEWYSTGKKRIPSYVWDKLCTLGLAVWFMDDGSYVNQRNWILYTNSFEEDIPEIVRYFERLGLTPSIGKDGVKPILIFNKEDSEQLTNLLSKYISIEEKQESGWKKWLCPSIEHGQWGVVGSEVEMVEPVVLGPRNRKYDITVEDNHNFFLASGQLVSNSGQHPNAAFWDEIEFWKIEAIEQTWYVPARQNGWDKLWVAMSTRQRSFGAANWLSEHAQEKGVKIYKWTAFETMQRCKSCIAIDQHPTGSDEMRSITCNLWEDCHGKRGTKSSGWVPLEDVQKLKRSLSKAAWRVQGICDKPSSTGLVLSNFEHDYRIDGGNYSHFTYQPNLPLYVTHDPAEGKKSCLYFIQIHEGNVYVFDEIIQPECPNTSTTKAEFYRHCRDKGYADPVVIVVDPRKTDAIADWKLGSYSGEGISKRYRAVAPPIDNARGGQLVSQTIEYLRKQICDGEGVRRLFVNPKQCPGLVRGIREYHYPTDMNNVVTSDTPDKDYSDEIDPLRYFMQYYTFVIKTGNYSIHWLEG